MTALMEQNRQYCTQQREPNDAILDARKRIDNDFVAVSHQKCTYVLPIQVGFGRGKAKARPIRRDHGWRPAYTFATNRSVGCLAGG